MRETVRTNLQCRRHSTTTSFASLSIIPQTLVASEGTSSTDLFRVERETLQTLRLDNTDSQDEPMGSGD